MGDTFEPDEPEKTSSFAEIDFRRYWHLLLSKAWLLILIVVVAGFAAGAYLSKLPRIYSSSATLEVELEARKVVNIQEIASSEYRSSEALKTVEQSLKSSTLMLRVVKNGHLADNVLFAKPKPDGSAYSEGELVGMMQASVSVALRRGTRLIDIVAESESPLMAQQIVQTLVDEFLASSLDQKLAVSRVAGDALQREANELRAKLERSEKSLQEYREKNNAVSLEDKQNIIVDKLKDLNQKVTEAKSNRLKLEGDMALIRNGKIQDPEQLLLLDSVAAHPEVQSLRSQIHQKEVEFSVIKERYLELHPKYIQAQVQIKELRQSLERMALKAGEQLERTYESAKATEDKLAQALAEQEKVALDLTAISVPYNVLSREVESDRALFAAVLNRLKETNVAQGLDSNNIRLIDAPIVANSPIRPQPRSVMTRVILLSLLFGVALVIGLDTFNSTIRSVDDAELTLGLPVLAAIPITKLKPDQTENMVHSAPNSLQSEAFRSLRAGVALLGMEADRRVVMLTSSVPAEGKTFCALNFASTLAQQGHRTLLVDADLRRPRLSSLFAKDSPATAGLSDCLSGGSTLLKACRPTGVPELTLLSAGSRAPNPAELLGSKALQDLIDEALQHFDRIVIDSSPVNAVSDALMLAGHAQSICMVIRTNSTPRRAILRALRMIGRTGKKPQGLILNRVSFGKGASDHYYYYGGQYAEPQPASKG